MSAKNYSIRIEALLRKVNGQSYCKSDEILLDPYTEIILALEQRVSQEKLDKFKSYYQAIKGQTLQSLVEDNYNVEQLISDLKQTIENN